MRNNSWPSDLILALASSDFQFKLSHLSPLSFHGIILLAGIPAFVIACIVARFCRPRVLSACLLFVPLPLVIAFFAVIDQLDKSSSSSGIAQSLLMIIIGVLSSIPAYAVLARGILMHVNEHDRR